MFEYLTTQKKRIVDFLRSYVEETKNDFQRINQWGTDALDRLEEYATRGKMIRGSLVLFAHELCRGSLPEQALRTGAAMEIFQSAFLIHDDIMDQDLFRRGKPSIHAQYRSLLNQRDNRPHPAVADRTGDNLGICVGDIALFLAFDLLGSLEAPPATLHPLFRLFTRELSYVGLAQMEDVYYGAVGEGVGETHILNLYRYKTGRYTFSLPLMAGGILAGASSQQLEQFSLLGERLGVLFQIKDDELGLFAEQGELGKPIGSDVISNKKTLFRYWAYEAANPEEKAWLNSLFGAPSLTRQNLDRLRSYLKEKRILEKGNQLMASINDECLRIIERMEMDPRWRRELLELVAYNRDRSK